MSIFSVEEINLRKLSIADDTGFFDCGNSDLNDYIRYQAKDQQLQHAAVIYLALFNTQIAGFLSLV
ncbi:MAG: hypothetical protein ABSF00_03450 [Candidatus Bathyarchaeia archaeon]